MLELLAGSSSRAALPPNVRALTYLHDVSTGSVAAGERRDMNQAEQERSTTEGIECDR